MSYLMTYIYTIHLKLGDIIVQIHTYKLCNIEIYVLLNFSFCINYVEIPQFCDCPEGATSHIDMYGKTTNFKMSYLMTYICYPFKIWRSYFRHHHLIILGNSGCYGQWLFL